MLKQLLLILIVMSIGVTMMVQNSHALTFTNNMEITEYCGLTALSTPIRSANFLPEDISGDIYRISFDNFGTINGTLDVSATNWLTPGTGINIIDGNQTKFAFTQDLDYADKIQLNKTDTTINMGNVTNYFTIDTFWEIDVKLNDLSFDGPLEQIITFDLGC